MDLWLDPIPSEEAVPALASRDVIRSLGLASNEYGLALVSRNIHALLEAGLYERALLYAFTGTRTNNRGWPLDTLRWLLGLADRGRLLEAGDPLPPGETFTLYRGVAGAGAARRVRGLS